MLHIVYKNCMYVTFFHIVRKMVQRKKKRIQFEPSVYSVRNAGRAFFALMQFFDDGFRTYKYNVIGSVLHEHFVVSDYFIYFEWTEHTASYPIAMEKSSI